MQTRDMTQGSPIRLIMAVALPLMAGNVFQQLYTVVDAQVVGKVEGVFALAALGATDWFHWLFLGIIQGLTQGFTIPMAQAFGAKDYGYLRRCVGNAVLLALGMSVIVTLCAHALLVPVLRLMETPQTVFHISVSYLRVLFSAFPVVIAYNLMAGILRALGDGRSPLYAMVVASIVNIGLDLLLVAVFRWGVLGAAAATVIAQACSCLFCLYRLSRIEVLHLQRHDLRLNRGIALRLARLGLPVAGQNATIGVGGMVVQRIVNDMGVTFIAGYTATNKLYGVLEIAAISYGYAVSTYAGQNLGAGEHERIRKGVHAAVLTGIATAVAIAAVMFWQGENILSGFISGTPEEVAEATRYGREFLYLMSACLPVLYILHLYRSALQGMGNTVMPMLSGVAEMIMRVGAAMYLPAVVGYWGLFHAETLAWFGADLILVTGYYRTLRKTNLADPHGNGEHELL